MKVNKQYDKMLTIIKGEGGQAYHLGKKISSS